MAIDDCRLHADHQSPAQRSTTNHESQIMNQECSYRAEHGVGFQPAVPLSFLNWTVFTYGPFKYCASSRILVTTRYELPSGSAMVMNHSVIVAFAPSGTPF